MTSLKVADFDGDGNLDIVVIGGHGVEFSVLPGNGDGTFGAPRKFAVGSRAVDSLDVADLDGSGHPSVVVKHADANNIFYTVLVNATPTQADLAIGKTDSPDPVTVGSNLTYTIAVTNNGAGAATGVTMTDPLPGTVTFVSATPSQGTCSGTTTCSRYSTDGALPVGACGESMVVGRHLRYGSRTAATELRALPPHRNSARVSVTGLDPSRRVSTPPGNALQARGKRSKPHHR